MKRKATVFLSILLLLSIASLIFFLIRHEYKKDRSYQAYQKTHSKTMTLASFLECHNIYARVAPALDMLDLDAQHTGKAYARVYHDMNQYYTATFYCIQDGYDISISPDSPSLISLFRRSNDEETKERYEISYGYDALLAKEKAIEFMDTLGPVLKSTPIGVSIGPVIESQHGSVWRMLWPMHFGKANCGCVKIYVSLVSGQIELYSYVAPMIPRRTIVKIDEQAATAIADAWTKERGYDPHLYSGLHVCLPNNYWRRASRASQVQREYVPTLAWVIGYKNEHGRRVEVSVDTETGKVIAGHDVGAGYVPREW